MKLIKHIERKAWAGLTGTLIFLLSGTTLHAQEKIDIQEIRKKYPQEELISLRDEEHVVIKVEDGKLDIRRQDLSTMLYLTGRAPEYADKSIFYVDSMEEISKVDAKTYIPEGKGYRTMKAKDIKTSKATGRGIFYDDHQEIKIFLPGLTSGAMSSVSYEEKLNDPHFLGSYYFKMYVPAENSSFSVEFPKNVKLRYIFRGDSSGIKFSMKSSGKNIKYTWEGKNLAKIPYESDAPDIRYYTPHIILFIEEYTIDGKTTPVFSDVDRLYGWYYDFIKPLGKNEDPSMAGIVDSLTKGVTSEKDKARKIFYWVENHIKYIAFENGLGGFIPREASSVCNKRYGDCKDMANLLFTMLSKAGIKAHRCWIGTRDIPYTYKEVPTPAVDNHMIAMIELDGKQFFLDATGSNLPLGLPTPMIQGKEALVSYSEKKYELVTVPVVPMETNLSYDSTILRMDGNELKGTSYNKVTGLSKYLTVINMLQYDDAKREEQFKKRIQRGNNKCKVDDLQIKGFDELDADLTMQYKFTLPDYIVRRDNELYINLSLDKLHSGDDIDTSHKKLDIERETKYMYKFVTVLQIPEGYKAGNLPPAASFKKNEFGYTVDYSQNGKTITMKQTFYSNFLILQNKKFTEWNEMIESLGDTYRETIVLKKQI